MLRWFRLGTRQVRIPDSWDVVRVDGTRYIRRRRLRATYWVDARGREWWRTPQRPQHPVVDSKVAPR